VTAPNWDLLDQDEYWDTEREGRVRLVDMSPSHRANLLAWLRAPHWAQQGEYVAGPLVDRLEALVAEDRANEAGQ
jgi:hypothetical protein